MTVQQTRRAQVAGLVARGFTAQQIADGLGIDRKTVHRDCLALGVTPKQYRPKNEPERTTCGDKRGTLTGVTRHRRANENLCSRCQQADRKYHTERGRTPQVAARRRQGQKARRQALNELARRHNAEFRQIYLTVLARAEQAGGDRS